MSDSLCSVCCEPWDSYGVKHGDIAPWEAKLFSEGAGCPSCKGVAPAGCNLEDAAEAHARSIIMGDDDGDEGIQALAVLDASVRPAWKRPENPVIWECAGCGSQVCRDLDVTGVEIVRPRPYESFRPYVSGLVWNVVGQPSRLDEAHHPDEWEGLLQDTITEAKEGSFAAPGDRKIDGKPYCTSCAEFCDHCGDLTLSSEIQMPEGRYRRGEGVCGSCYDEIPRCGRCCAELAEDEPTNHDGYGPCCAEHCDRCKHERGENVMLDRMGDCPACAKWRAAVRARRRKANHRRRVRRGW